MKKGIYTLIIKNNKQQKIQVGKLDQIKFPKGFYVYVGSAQNNLQKRIKRHKSKHKNLHWHIDYILEKMNIINVLTFSGKKKKECELANQIKSLSGSYVRGFGCSDCSCKSHLFYFKNRNQIDIKSFR